MLRVAAWPIETLDVFTAVELAGAASGVLALARAIDTRAPALVSAIHSAVPRVADRQVRAYLLALKRGIHGGHGVVHPFSQEIVDRLNTLEPGIGALVDQEIRQRVELAAERQRFDALFAAELCRQRGELHRVSATPAFQRALAIGNPSLAARWKPAVGAKPALSERARERRLEASIFHTLMRAVGRPTPQGAWAGIAAVRPAGDGSFQGGGEGCGSRLSIEPGEGRRFFAVDMGPFAATLAALRRLPRYRASALRLNPTVRDAPGGWRFERVTPAGLRWESVPSDPACQLLVEAYRDGRPRRSEPVICRLAGNDDALSATLGDAVAHLLDVGVLCVDVVMPRGAETAWEALEAVTPALLPEDRPRWSTAVSRVRQACENLGRRFDELDPEGIASLRRVVEVEIEALWRWVGLRGRLTQPVLHLDTCVPLDARWDGAARRRFEDAVGAVLAFHRADGAAERYRRVSLDGVVAAMAIADDDTLLALVDGTGLRRRPPTGDDMDTHEGIFARFTGTPSPDVVAHCRQWERRLGPVAAKPCVTLDVDDGDDLPLAGPEGAFVLSLLSGGGVVTEWGRPQAGMFVARLASLLVGADGDASGVTAVTAVTAVTELRRRAAALGARGVVVVEVVGSDPASLNTAVQPRITPRRLDPHGPPGSSLGGLRLELDRHSRRPWIVGPAGERILPVYHSAAAIGGVDPCSWLLFRLAMGHGWELASFGFPALASERASWLHLPRLVLPGGTVLSAERWTIPGETLRAIQAFDEPGRYLAWRAQVERLGLPPLVRVRWEPHPASPPILMRTDSPMAVSALFLRLPPDSPRLVVTEVPGGLDGHAIRSATGEHHVAELAVSWYDDSYWDEVGGGAVVSVNDREASGVG